MKVEIRKCRKDDIPSVLAIWNEITADGMAFPHVECMEIDDFSCYLAEQSVVKVLTVNQTVAGFYFLHPNNIGRCAHVANASYGIDKSFRGKGLAEWLVGDSLTEARNLEFHGMQFNAVVSSNEAALQAYQKQGFHIVGTIPGGFRLIDDRYSDMYIMYLDLNESR